MFDMRYPLLYIVIYMLTTSATRKSLLEDNRQSDETARLEWFRVEPWLISHPELPEPPSLPVVPPPPVGPPQPPGTPYPPPQPPGTPPPPPQPPSPPLPPPQPPGHQSITHTAPLAHGIRCSNTRDKHSISAMVTLPNGFSASPVFNDAPSVNPSKSPYCNIKRSTFNARSYYLKVMDFKECGVFVHSGNEEKQSWLSLTIRFPYVEGLRLMEDEYAMLVCRPQDRTAFREHTLEMKGKLPHLSKTIFRNVPQDFECKMALFAKSSSGRFQRSVSSESFIRIGEDVQLRAIVRPGDGWKYAAMTDVVVYRNSPGRTPARATKLNHGSPRHVPHQLIKDNDVNSIDNPSSERSNDNSFPVERAILVFDNGCRNPKFRNIAPHHPYADSTSSLIVNFNFRTFMFQDMEDGDSLKISAKIIACINAVDCQLSLCEDADRNHGRHRRSSSVFHSSYHHGNRSSITRDLDVVVRMPGYVAAAMAKFQDENEILHDKDKVEGSHCRTFAIGISVVSLLFCLAITAAATLALRSRRIQVLHNTNKTEK